METPRNDGVDWRRTLVLPVEIKQSLTELAQARDRSVAAEIRVALREHVGRHAWERVR